MRGLFLMDRATIDHPVVGIKTPKRFAAWVWMLAEARWKPRDVLIVGRVATLKRGQMSCSIRFMAERLNMSVQEVRTFIKTLKSTKMINTETNTGQLVITICNYEKYQNFDEYKTQRSTHHQHRSNAALTQEQHRTNTGATQTRTPEGTPDYPSEDKSSSGETRVSLDQSSEDQKWIWGAGLSYLNGNSQDTERSIRSILGEWMKNHEPSDIRQAIETAQVSCNGRPINYVLRTLQARRADQRAGAPSYQGRSKPDYDYEQLMAGVHV